jgi:hypothetical protein
MISGNHFRHPIAQSAQYAVSIVIIARMILPEPGIAQSGAPKSRERGGLLPTIQPRAINWAITLRRWNMRPQILRVEFAIAKISVTF